MSLSKEIAKIYRCTLTVISPKLNTKACYKSKFKRKLNLNNPKTFNEKLLWLKFNTYWKNPTVKQCADKYAVRDYIKNLGFSDILIPLIAAYTNPDEIEWDKLPESFAIKLNVGSGKNIIVKDKSKLDINETVKTLKKWMKEKYYLHYSEMQYKDVKPYILFEEYIGGEKLPVDYKFYCFNGKVHYIQVCEDRVLRTGAKLYYMDLDWNMLPYSKYALREPDKVIEKPALMDDAIILAEKMTKEFPFVRLDLYIVGDKIYFGEYTFTPVASLNTKLTLIPPNSDVDVDTIFGRELKLPKTEDKI